MLNNLDLKKEEINFKDSGCRFSSSCLSCPIEICVYDNPSLVRNLEKSTRDNNIIKDRSCLLYTSPSPRDLSTARMPSSA